VTHRLTFASAVRHAAARFSTPDVLRLLVQSVAFTHSGAGMDAPPERRLAVGSSSDAGADAVLDAIVHRRPEAAIAAAAACLERRGEAARLRTAIEDLCLRDPLVRPIVLCHAIKTATVAFDEHEVLAPEHRARPVLAVVRFLASHQTVRTSIRWVVEGVVPKKLTQ
jgi:hypothetical protein